MRQAQQRLLGSRAIGMPKAGSRKGIACEKVEIQQHHNLYSFSHETRIFFPKSKLAVGFCPVHTVDNHRFHTDYKVEQHFR